MITRTQFRNLRSGNFLSYPSGEGLAVYNYFKDDGDWKCFWFEDGEVKLRFRQGGEIIKKGSSKYTNSQVPGLMQNDAQVGTYRIH